MAKPRKPQRSDSRFPRGLKGDRMYQLALQQYNRTTSGNLSITDKLFGMSQEAQAARRRAALRIHQGINRRVEGAVSKVKADVTQFNRSANEAAGIYHTGSYKDGDIVTKNGKQYRFNASTKQFVLVKPRPRGMSNIDPKEADAPVNVEARKPKPQSKPDQPAAAQPKPKPQPTTLSAAELKKRAEAAAKKKADAAAMKAELLKIRKAELASERQKAYQKSLEQAKENRARGRRPRGPRDRY